MPTLVCSMSAAMASVCSLLAQMDASAATLAVSPLKLLFVLAWVYSSLYLVQRVNGNRRIPGRYRPIFYVVTLWVGPLVFLTTWLLDWSKSKSRKPGSPLTNVFARFQGVFAGSRLSQDPADATLQLFDSLGAELSEIYGHGQKGGPDQHILNMTSQIIEDALQQRASDILIDPKDQASYAIRLRVDGALRTVRELPAETCKAVINSVKAVSSMDISERRRPQDGAFTAKQGNATFSFRVTSAGALNGEKLSIRVLNKNAGRITLVDIGIPERQRSVITNAIGKPSGMVLICGPTGSGKTTTLYSMLNQIDRATHNVITVEDPIEAQLPEVSQLEINAKADITFAKALRSILRQDPDVICVGEIRDEETAEIALRAAQTGHLVLATIHCDSNATALIRLLDLGVSPMLLSSGLSLLVSQRLVRKLCEKCRKPAKLNPTMLQEFRQRGVDTSKIFAPGGCEACGKTGYYGRTAICDLLVVTEEWRTEIAHDESIAHKLRTDGEKKGRSNLRSEAITRLIAGVTSLEEIKRVVG